MMKEVSVALVGLGGYGDNYVHELFDAPAERQVRLVAGIDPYADRSGNQTLFEQAGIPIYPDLGSFYRKQTANLVVISTAIHLHASQTILALENGSHVLCEKPVCGSLSDLRQMMEAEERCERFVAIGYQWSFSRAVQALKQDVLAGVLGRPVRLKTLVLWPRHRSYYRRNDWAGKVKTTAGEFVLDSPVHNATAHYLHNMLYITGDTWNSSAWPVAIQAECFRANAIQNFDAAAMRLRTHNGAEVLFYSAHSVRELIGPVAEYEFENAVVSFVRSEDTLIQAHFRDGRQKSYGNPDMDHLTKLWQAVGAVRGEAQIVCGLQAGTPEVVCVTNLPVCGAIQPFPTDLVHVDTVSETDQLVWVEGLKEAFTQSWTENRLPTEIGVFPWVEPGRLVEIAPW
jgi:predicted dehydrogenase